MYIYTVTSSSKAFSDCIQNHLCKSYHGIRANGINLRIPLGSYLRGIDSFLGRELLC